MDQPWKGAKDRADRVKLLSLVDVLEPLTREELDHLAQRTPERSFGSGDIVYVPGDASEVVYLLLSGRIRLYGMTWDRELTFEVIRSGSVFGIASMAERTQDEYAQALEPSQVGLLSLNAFWRLVRENPEVNARVIKLLGERLRRNRGRTIDIALKEVHARLAGLILDLVEGEGIIVREGYYAIPTPYTHEQLSTMIGAKRVAVTRAFGVLQAAGCVRLSRRQIHVIDLAALKRFAIAR